MSDRIDLDTMALPEFGELDALFSKARESQPVLADENFSKVLANSLPSKPVPRRNRAISFDVIGALVGLFLTYLLFDLSQVVRDVLNFIPETLTLSPMHLLVALALISGMSVLAWWTVENSRI